MNATHQDRLTMLRHSIDGIAEGRIPLRDLSRPIRARNSGITGPYYFTPGPVITGRHNAPEGFAGYLTGNQIAEGSFARLRVRRADDIIRLRHSGWFTDEHCDETMYGVVATLPRSRGFLAGWSLGEGMATSFSRDIHATAEDAARAADEEARIAAEKEREYRANETADDTE
jgi:hypothetical protein